MKFGEFHHPSISLPILRRRAGEELLELVAELGELLVTRGRSATWNKTFPNDAAYRNAVYRLRKGGLVACVRKDGVPHLQLTADGRKQASAGLNPEPYWNQRWSGLWYTLMYDVPERRRPYRESLRLFLKRMRMGQLQRSVWITPRDVRPEFDDMARAAGLRDYAYLFEFRSGIGATDAGLAQRAWNFEALGAIQDWFCREIGESLKRIARGHDGAALLTQLVREERTAFLRVMDGDPLLPRALWPESYKGHDVWQLHREFLHQVKRRL